MNNIDNALDFDFEKMITNAQKECHESLIKLEEKLNSSNKLEILSRISILTQFRSEGTSFSEYYGTLSDTACMPFIIGLSLKSREISENEPSFQDIEEILNLLESFFNNFGLALRPKTNTPESYEEIVYSARIHGLIGQINPERYPFQILELLEKSFEGLDDFFKTEYGFTVKDAITFGRFIEDNYVRNLNERKKTVFEAEVPEEEKFKIFYSEVRELLEIVPEVFCDHYHIENIEAFKKYLSAFACHFGEGNPKFDSPLDNNTIFYKPLIYKNEKYYPFIPLYLIQNLPSIFENFLTNEKIANSKVWQRYKENKSNFTEDKVKECLARIFPEDDINNNLFFEENGKMFEVDHIIPYCNNIIIIESKSGNFSHSAKRGGIKRIKTDLSRLICDAHDQALRVKNYISSNTIAEFHRPNERSTLKIQAKKNTIFILINVTLEHLYSFSSNLKHLEKLGIFSTFDYPWSVSLFELDLISKYLKSPAIFIHYIERRLKVQDQNNFSTYDELSYLGLYLEKGNFFFFTKEGKKFDSIAIDPNYLSEFDDHYLLGKDAPKLIIEDEIKKIINELEELRPNNFTEISNFLLDLDHPSRANFIQCLKRIISNTQIDGNRHDFSFIVKPKNIGITVFSQIGRENLLNHLSLFCELKKYQARSDTWLGLGIDVLDPKFFINEFFFDGEKWEKDSEIETTLEWANSKGLLKVRPDFEFH